MSSRAWKVRTLFGTSAMMMVVAAQPAFAQSAEDFAAMRAEIQALRAAQQQSDAEIADLKAQLTFQPAVAATQVRVIPSASVPSSTDQSSAAASSQAVPQKAGGSFVTRTPVSSYYASAAGPVNPAGGSAPGYGRQPQKSLT